MKSVNVVKVGGNELDDEAFLAGLCTAVAAFPEPLVLVHGGGKEISAALDLYDLPSHFVDGLRVTSTESMHVMEMVVCGSINKRLVARLGAAGVRALGLSGVDLGLLRCRPHRPAGVDLGWVGAITQVDTAALRAMLELGWLPVFAPVAYGEHDCRPYNVNADHVAQALAVAFGAMGGNTLTFVSNVPGVLLEGRVVPQLSAAAIEAAIETGQISGGMVPKVRAALGALEAGLAAVRITDLAGFAAGGTTIVHDAG